MIPRKSILYRQQQWSRRSCKNTFRLSNLSPRQMRRPVMPLLCRRASCTVPRMSSIRMAASAARPVVSPPSQDYVSVVISSDYRRLLPRPSKLIAMPTFHLNQKRLRSRASIKQIASVSALLKISSWRYSPLPSTSHNARPLRVRKLREWRKHKNAQK